MKLCSAWQHLLIRHSSCFISVRVIVEKRCNFLLFQTNFTNRDNSLVCFRQIMFCIVWQLFANKDKYYDKDLYQNLEKEPVKEELEIVINAMDEIINS